MKYHVKLMCVLQTSGPCVCDKLRVGAGAAAEKARRRTYPSQQGRVTSCRVSAPEGSTGDSLYIASLCRAERNGCGCSKQEAAHASTCPDLGCHISMQGSSGGSHRG